jgi:carbon starvation protein
MFVVIACGAISGFHSLVASGTTPKQVSSEPDAQFVGYGSMLLEGVLAVLVIICVGAGIAMSVEQSDGSILTGSAAWQSYYGSWLGDKGLPDKLAPVVGGAANMMSSIGITKTIGIALMGVFIASFAGTTLDTSVRLQRYVISELASDLKIKGFANKWTATTLAVVTAAALAFANGAGGKGAMVLWPLFGIANQLLAALALLVVTMYLKRKGGLKYLLTAIPSVIMLTITVWAMVIKEQDFIADRQWTLIIIGAILFVLSIWMVIETAIAFFGKDQKQEAIEISERQAESA